MPFLTRELLKLLGLFDAHGVRAIPYKGPTLAAIAYGNLALREFDDLDVLVDEPDVPKAKELLVSMGYLPQYHLSNAQEVALLRHHYAQGFSRSDVDSTIELHWRIAERHFSFPLTLEGVWERLEHIHLSGDTALSTKWSRSEAEPPRKAPSKLSTIPMRHVQAGQPKRIGRSCDDTTNGGAGASKSGLPNYADSLR